MFVTVNQLYWSINSYLGSATSGHESIHFIVLKRLLWVDELTIILKIL